MADPVEAITVNEIDQALVDRFQAAILGRDGRLVSRLIRVDGKEVDLFIEAPDMALVEDPSNPDSNKRNRRFPAISINFVSCIPDDQRLESHDCRVEVCTNTADVQRTHEEPQPYKVAYNLHTWARNIHDDRQLLQQLIASFTINDTLLINEGYWNIEMGNIAQVDQYFENVDQITYHKVWPIDIIAVMFPTNLFTDTPLVLQTITEYPIGNQTETLTFDGTNDTFEIT